MGILIVEDDEGVRESLETLLREEGFEVDSASDGAGALERLRGAELPSLILLDLVMPGMDGIEFRSRQLADGRLREIPVIILSARPDGERAAAKLGAADFLPKPMNFEALLHAVQNRAVTVVTSVDLPGQPKTLRQAWNILQHETANAADGARVRRPLECSDSSPER